MKYIFLRKIDGMTLEKMTITRVMSKKNEAMNFKEVKVGSLSLMFISARRTKKT